MNQRLCNVLAFKSLAFVQRTGMKQKRSKFICSGCKPLLSNPNLVGMTNNLYLRQDLTETCLRVLNRDVRVL